MPIDPTAAPPPRRILMLGATGTIGRATVAALLARGHQVCCVVRPPRTAAARQRCDDLAAAGAELRVGDVADPRSLADDGVRGERFDVLISCLASRTGAPADAWRIDCGAHLIAIDIARRTGIGHMILLSAICVQRPVLAFQHAKLAAEAALRASGLAYTIVRPTAFFKSLSGQVARVREGRRFLVFGNGTLTACRPISDGDLAAYLADCIDRPDRRNRILPIGGPGDAITPRMQGEALFAMLGRPARFTHVPVALLDAVVAVLSLLGRIAPSLRAKAELARIGRYYATESMLLLDPATGRYDADATPATGRDTLVDHYARLVRDDAVHERGDHAVF